MHSAILALSLLTTLVSALRGSKPASATAQTRSAQTCGDPADAVPFYSTFNSATVDYYYTADAAFVDVVFPAPSGYALQGLAGLVFVTQEESTVPFYRLHQLLANSVNNNFFTTNTTERVQPGPDRSAHVYIPDGDLRAVPFYRVFNPGAQANFYTTSESRRLDFIANQGYEDWELLGIFCRSWLRSAFEFYICNLFVFGHDTWERESPLLSAADAMIETSTVVSSVDADRRDQDLVFRMGDSVQDKVTGTVEQIEIQGVDPAELVDANLEDGYLQDNEDTQSTHFRGEMSDTSVEDAELQEDEDTQSTGYAALYFKFGVVAVWPGGVMAYWVQQWAHQPVWSRAAGAV
ncbi:hypothetical protein B0H13DRAFT_1935701 [Mycena leptocephala]|nr:hypothetical protein B0H13DRAFT_1935701 [Mycena leptocephala]